MESFTVATQKRTDMVDITARVQGAVRATGLQSGICTVFVPHTTAGITINENADTDVIRDILMEMNTVIPFTGGYAHSEGNSAAHIKSSLFGCTLNVIVEGGSLQLGTWQSIFLCEFDGPRNRTVWTKVLGA
jgi:secondary thiamine-phosphate synthase enzyme